MKLQKQIKKNNDGKSVKNYRFLIIIDVLGNAGPIRFVVNKNDKVLRVIAIALKFYARERRLPILSSDANSFILYSANAGFDALDPSELIGSSGVRNFRLGKKQTQSLMREATSKENGSSWKTWINKFHNILFK